MRSVVLVVGGFVLALVLVISNGDEVVSRSAMHRAEAAPMSGGTPKPKTCVECDDDGGAAQSCSGVPLGDEGATSCDFSNGYCVEVGYCWVSSDFPVPSPGMGIN